MGYTTPFSAVAGTAWKAADWNTHGRDNIAWIATDSPTARAYNSAALSVADVTNTALTLNSERYDNASLHSTATNTSRITIPTGGDGKYVLGISAAFAASAAGTNRSFWVYLNATTRVGQADVPFNATSGGTTALTTVYSVAAADYLEAYANQNSGGALNVTGQPGTGPEFFAFWFRN